MKKKITLIVILFILSIFIISESKTLIKTLTNQNKVLEDIKTIDIFDNKDKTLSIMLQEDGINFTEAKNRDAWPDITKYTYEKAECTDSTGATVDYKTILTFNYDSTNPTTTIKTNKTVYCTLYFVKGNDTLTLLKQKGRGTFQEKNGMYRFVGTNTQVKNNYICFGTTDTSLCTSEADKYMYRIIGMTKDADTDLGIHANQLKIIKAIPYGEDIEYHSSCNIEVNWDESTLNEYLNGTSTSNQFLYSIQHLASGSYWDGLITNQLWYTMRFGSDRETGTPTNTKSKIGLMYATDFVNAYKTEAYDNWLLLRNGWSGNSIEQSEWTMSRYENTDMGVLGIYVHYSGSLPGVGLCSKFFIRPAFYLKPSVMLSGDGSTTDPFKIAG